MYRNNRSIYYVGLKSKYSYMSFRWKYGTIIHINPQNRLFHRFLQQWPASVIPSGTKWSVGIQGMDCFPMLAKTGVGHREECNDVAIQGMVAWIASPSTSSGSQWQDAMTTQYHRRDLSILGYLFVWAIFSCPYPPPSFELFFSNYCLVNGIIHLIIH